MLGIEGISSLHIALLALWTLPWKGWALWLAARRQEKWWFIALLVLNTLALIEIIYIFFVAKRSVEKEEKSELASPASDE